MTCIWAVFCVLTGRAQEFEEVYGFNSTSYGDRAHSVAKSLNGDRYIGGSFTYTMDLNPGSGTQSVVSQGYEDAFLVKLNASGAFQWGFSIGESQYEEVASLDLDANGSVYTLGTCGGYDDIDFDPSGNTFNLNPDGASNAAFFAKYTASGGLVFAHLFNEDLYSEGKHLAIHPNGSQYLAVQFHGIVDIELGSGTTNLSVPGGTKGAFIAKYYPSGMVAWGVQAESPQLIELYDMSVNQTGDVALCGQFKDSIRIDTGAGYVVHQALGDADYFVMVFDSNGTYISSMALGSDSEEEDGSVELLDDLSLFVSSIFVDTVDLNGPLSGGEVYPDPYGSEDAFIAFYNPSGGLEWSAVLDGTGDNVISAMQVNSYGELEISGYFNGTADFDFSNGFQNITSVGYGTTRNCFYAKYNLDGDYQEASNIGSGGQCYVYDMKTYDDGIFISGLYAGTVDFDPSSTTNSLTSNGAWHDGFMSSYCGDEPSSVIDDSICFSGSYFLEPFGSYADGLIWSTGDTSAGITITSPGQYFYTLTSNCWSVEDSVVMSTAQYLPNLGNDTSFCLGDTILLDAGILGSGHTWSTGATSPSITVTQAGQYWVELYNGCGWFSDTMHVLETWPGFPLELGPDTGICYYDSLVLTTSYSGVGQTLWSTNETTAGIVVSDSGQYWVQLIDSNGCQVSDSIQVDLQKSTMYGHLWDPFSTVLQNVKVLLISYDSNQGYVQLADSTYTDAQGEFSMLVDSGNYFVKAVFDSTLYPNHIHSYHFLSATVQGATPILVECDSVFAGFEVLLGSNPGGSGFIGGFIAQGAGRAEGDPVSNLSLILMSDSEEPLHTTSTSSSGYFRFDDLDTGSYKIFVDSLGISNQAAPEIKLTTDNLFRDSLLFELNSKYLKHVGPWPNGINYEHSNALMLFPNPSSGFLNIRSQTTLDSKQDFHIYSSDASLVYSGQMDRYTTQVDLSFLSPGLYTFRSSGLSILFILQD